MKLLVNAISAKQGGIATYTKNLIETMRRIGVDATFAVPANFPAEGRDLLRVSASDYGSARRLVWEQSVWRAIVLKYRPDLLFSSANFGLCASPVPQVLLMREGGLFDPFYLANVAPAQGVRLALLRRWRRQWMLASASWSARVLTPSHAMRDLILHWRPELASKSIVCAYGTRPDLFQATLQKHSWRHGNELRLLYVSVYYAHKNPAALCQVLDKLRSVGINARGTITMTIDEVDCIAGSANDREILRRSVANGTITLIGHKDYASLPALYESHDIFFFPSVSESFGHPMAEAMGMGMPIVAADTPINREVCGDAALYFHPFRPSEAVRCIGQLDDASTREALSAVGRRRVATSLRWEDHVSQLLEIFKTVVDEHRPTH